MVVSRSTEKKLFQTAWRALTRGLWKVRLAGGTNHKYAITVNLETVNFNEKNQILNSEISFRGEFTEVNQADFIQCKSY